MKHFSYCYSAKFTLVEVGRIQKCVKTRDFSGTFFHKISRLQHGKYASALAKQIARYITLILQYSTTVVITIIL